MLLYLKMIRSGGWPHAIKILFPSFTQRIIHEITFLKYSCLSISSYTIRMMEDVHMCIKLPWTYPDFRKEKRNKNIASCWITTLCTLLSSSCRTRNWFTDPCKYPEGFPEMFEAEDSIKDRFFCRQTSCYKGLIKSCYKSKF